MTIKEIGNEMYEIGMKNAGKKQISAFIKTGNWTGVIKAKSGKIFSAKNVSAKCGLDYCAEKNAIIKMLQECNEEIEYVMAVSAKGEIAISCGTCREFMMQLGEYAREIKIFKNKEEVVRLGDMNPDYWGDIAYREEKELRK